MRKIFYPLGYEDQFFLKWHHFKQGQGQSLEDFYEEYQDLIIQLDIKELNNNMILKFLGGLHRYLRHELKIFPFPSLHEAFKIASKIEARRKASTSSERKPNKKVSLILDTSSTISSPSKSSSTYYSDRGKRKRGSNKKNGSSKGNKKSDLSNICSHCGNRGYDKDDFYTLHLEKSPKSLHQWKLKEQFEEFN